MIIFFAVAAALSLLVMIGERKTENKRYYTYAFLGAVAGIVVMSALKMAAF